MEAANNIPISRLIPAPAAAIEFTAAGYRFEHHPDPGTGNLGRVTLSHPGCPRLSVDYGTRDCFSQEQAVQLILYVYQKEYQFR